MTIKVTLRADKLNAIRANVQGRTVEQVRDNATYLRDYAEAIAPRDTGAFAASLYVNGPDPNESDYSLREARAITLNQQANIVPELIASNLGQSGVIALVASAVEYGLYLELGTRYMAPRPTFFQAAEATRDRFITGMKTVADG